jgi:streptogramin lyase
LSRVVGNFFGSTISDVLKYDGTTGAFQSVFVPNNSGTLTFPLGGTFGPDGNFYVSNSDNDRVLEYDGATGASLRTFAMTVEDAAGLRFAPNGNLFVVDSSSPGSITELNGTTGAFMNVFVAPGLGGLTAGRDVTFGADGNLYATSSGATGGVLEYNGTTGAFIRAFVGPGSDLSLPRGLVFGPDGSLYVANFGAGDVLKFNGTTGAFMSTFVPSGSGGLGGPTFLVFHDTSVTGSAPEPSPVGFLGMGLTALAACGWKRRR